MCKSTLQPTSTGKVPANDELNAVMEILASLYMTAKTAERLIDFIITSAEDHLAADEVSTINLESLSSDLPSFRSDTNFDSSAPTLSPSSSEASLPLSGELSSPVILSSQSMESSFTLSDQAVQASPDRAMAEVTTSLITTEAPPNDSDTLVIPATPPIPTTTPAPPFNPMGPAHLLGTLGMHLESYNSFIYEMPTPDATGPFYLVT